MNLRPLRMEIEKSMPAVFKFQEDHPSKVLKNLLAKQVLIAPCSSIGLVKHPELDIALPLGVVGQRKIKSVYLGVKGDAVEFLSDRFAQRLAVIKGELSDCLESMPGRPRQVCNVFWKAIDQIYPQKCQLPFHLRLSPHSESSVALAKIFLRLFADYPTHKSLQSVASQSVSSQGSVELVIGDEALQREKEFQKIFDLGSFWYDFTGYNFVFAVWQSHGFDLPAGIGDRILSMAGTVERKMKIAANSYTTDFYRKDSSPVDLVDYWKTITYRLQAQDLSSLVLYLCLARSFVTDVFSESLIVKMHRWKERALTHS